MKQGIKIKIGDRVRLLKNTKIGSDGTMLAGSMGYLRKVLPIGIPLLGKGYLGFVQFDSLKERPYYVALVFLKPLNEDGTDRGPEEVPEDGARVTRMRSGPVAKFFLKFFLKLVGRVLP